MTSLMFTLNALCIRMFVISQVTQPHKQRHDFIFTWKVFAILCSSKSTSKDQMVSHNNDAVCIAVIVIQCYKCDISIQIDARWSTYATLWWEIWAALDALLCIRCVSVVHDNSMWKIFHYTLKTIKSREKTSESLCSREFQRTNW